MGNFKRLAALAGVAVVLCQTSAFAVILSPGGGVTSGLFENEPLGGTTLATHADTFTGPTFSGTLYSSVIANDASNPFGGLTFTYYYANVMGDPVSRFTVSPFTGFLTDVSYNQVGAMPTVAPSLIERSSSGAILRFNFGYPGSDIPPGMSSALLVVQTDATAYTPTLAGLIDGSTVNVMSFAPIIPEPGSVSLLLAGVTVLWLARRKS